MNTKAVYTFIDNKQTFHIYKHHDGYPSGACEWIRASLEKAWELPRFEASEFAAAFVAANKDAGGGVYLTTSYKDHGDLSYRYEISLIDDALHIKAFSKNGKIKKLIFEGSLFEFGLYTNVKFIKELSYGTYEQSFPVEPE